MIVAARLTPEERRTLGIAALTAACVAAATGLVSWSFEEAKRALAKHRERQEKDGES